MSEINVTPFVDVMMVLLIIFMVAAPLQVVGVPIELPRTAAQSLPTEQEVLDARPLVRGLRAILAERSSDRVFLRADGSIPYARVVQVMGALNGAGITNIGLVTEIGGPRLDGRAG